MKRRGPLFSISRAVGVAVLAVSLAATPALAVTVTKTATPTTTPSGGEVTFTIKVSDCGATFVGFCLITSITDDKHPPNLLECVTPAFFGGPFGDYECTYTREVSDPGPYPALVTNTTTVSGQEFLGGTVGFTAFDSATVEVTPGTGGPPPSPPSSSVKKLVGGVPGVSSIRGNVEGEVRSRVSNITVNTGNIEQDVENQLRNGPDADRIEADVRNRVR